MANGDLIKLGTLYMGGLRQLRPTKPVYQYQGGNIPAYQLGQYLEIRNTDTDDAYKIQWREVNIDGKKLLICDRNILVNMSWGNLHDQSLIYGRNVTIDGVNYVLRVLDGGNDARDISNRNKGSSPINNEWDRIVGNESNISGLPVPTYKDLDGNTTDDDLNGTHNQFWNWYSIMSWTKESYAADATQRTIKGSSSTNLVSWIDAYSSSSSVGWRPILEILNTNPTLTVKVGSTNIANNDIVRHRNKTDFAFVINANDSDTGDTLQYSVWFNNTERTTWTNINKNADVTYTIPYNSILMGNNVITVKVRDNKGAITQVTFTLRSINPNSYCQSDVYGLMTKLGYSNINPSSLQAFKPSGYNKTTISLAEIVNHLT